MDDVEVAMGEKKAVEAAAVVVVMASRAVLWLACKVAAKAHMALVVLQAAQVRVPLMLTEDTATDTEDTDTVKEGTVKEDTVTVTGEGEAVVVEGAARRVAQQALLRATVALALRMLAGQTKAEAEAEVDMDTDRCERRTGIGSGVCKEEKELGNEKLYPGAVW